VDDFSNVVTKIESPEMTEAWLSFILQCLQVWSQNFSFFSTSVWRHLSNECSYASVATSVHSMLHLPDWNTVIELFCAEKKREALAHYSNGHRMEMCLLAYSIRFL